MSLKTTTIGSFPKPPYIPVLDWFQTPNMNPLEAMYQNNGLCQDHDLEVRLVQGIKEVIADQIEMGIDIPTDGEVRRENYIHYHCRHLNGIDFQHSKKKRIRNGAVECDVPILTGKISPRQHFLAREWQVAQSFTDCPVKVTIPGPMTIADTLADEYYQFCSNPRQLIHDLADALNWEIRSLAESGCRYIQVDEPVFVRKPSAALAYGIEAVDRSFFGIPSQVTRVLHMCCGYPERLNQEDYPKADQAVYLELAEAIDDSTIDEVSIENAHRHNDLGQLLPRLTRTNVILGVVRIADQRVETVEEIRDQVETALEYIDGDRLILAPDCGLGMLDRQTAKAKLGNVVAAAKSVALAPALSQDQQVSGQADTISDERQERCLRSGHLR